MKAVERKLITWGPVLIFIAAMLWATDAPFRFHLTRGLNASFIVLAEHAVNIILVLPFLIRGWSEIKGLGGKQWLAVLAIGIGASALATILFTKSFSFMNPSVAIVLQKLQPLIAISLAVAFLKEHTGRRFWGWAILALAGAYILSFPDLVPRLYVGEAWNPHTLGVLLALGAAALWGCGTVLGRFLLASTNEPRTALPELAFADGRQQMLKVSETPPRLQFQTLTALRFLTAFIFLIILNFRGDVLETAAALTGKDILFIIIIAITSGFTSLMLYYRGLRHTRASIASIAELGFPLIAVIINAAALQVFLNGAQLFGTALLLVAVWKLTAFNRLTQENIRVALQNTQ